MADNGNGNNGRAYFYLKIIGVLVCILMGILSWVTLSAISANEVAHNDIKNMIVTMSQANNMRIEGLAERYNDFTSHAPPNHTHHADGSISRRLE